MLKVETDIPLPNHQRVSKYRWLEKLPIGTSVVVPMKDGKMPYNPKSLRHWCQENGIGIRTQSLPGTGIRVWRVEFRPVKKQDSIK